MFKKIKKLTAVTVFFGMMSSILPHGYIMAYGSAIEPPSETYSYNQTIDIGATNLRGIDINNGNTYVISCPNETPGDGKVYKHNENGNTSEIITGLNFPTGVAVTTNSAIYVVDADMTDPKVLKYDSDGQNPVQIGTKGDGEGQYNLPYNIDADNDGNVYVTDFNSKKILKFNAEGTFIKEISDDYTPCGIAVDRANGYVYVTDIDDYSVKKYDLNLDEEVVNDAEWTNLNSPVSLFVDNSGNVFVLVNNLGDNNGDQNSVKKFDSNGKLIATFGETGTNDGQLYADGDISTDEDGNVYVTDVTGRIQKFVLDYQPTISVKISGTEKVGNTLTAQLMIDDEDDTTTGPAVTTEITTDAAVTYEWYRLDNSDSAFNTSIGTDKTYKLTSNDLGKFIGVIATYEDEEYTDITGKITKNSSSSSGGSKSDSKTTIIKVDVTDGKNNTAVSQTEITRTTLSDGSKKDDVKYSADKAQQTVNALKKEGKDVARIVLPDEKDQVSEAKLSIPSSTLSVLSSGKINLEIDTENARLSLPKESIDALSKPGALNGDLYFRLVPVKDEKAQEDIQIRANKEQAVRSISGNNNVQVLGRPMEIETNISQRDVSITLPLKGVTIPTNQAERDAFLKDLGIFIEHSDGEKAVARGEIVEYTPGVLGLQFTVNKFSTFTIVKLNQEIKAGWKSTDGYWYFTDKTGTIVKGWHKAENGEWTYGGKDTLGTWFHLGTDGKMTTGWYKDTDGNWYYLCDGKQYGALGVMLTGWQEINGKWYYFNASGAMATSTVIDGYEVNEDGAWIN